MSRRTVFYEIISQRNGAMSATVKIEPGQVFHSNEFETYAEVASWVEGLRILMTACGAPLVQIGEVSNDTMDGMEMRLEGLSGPEFIPENGGGAGIRFRERPET